MMSDSNVASELEKLLSGIITRNQNVDICMCVDGSGSISSSQWMVIIESLRHLTQRFKLTGKDSPHRVGLVQFSNVAERQADFSSDAYDVTNSINRMRQMNGGTNTHLGIDKCLEMFSAYQRISHKLVILFTDGQSNDTEKLLEASNRAKNKFQVEIIAIGIGTGVNQPEIRSICDISRSFFIPSVDVLSSIFHYIATISYASPTVTVVRKSPKSLHVEVLFGSGDVGKGATTAFRLEFFKDDEWKSVGEKKIPDPQNPKASFKLDNLTPETEYSIRAIALLSGGLTAISEVVTIETLEEMKETYLLKDKAALVTEVDKLRKEILEWDVPDDAKSLLEYITISLFGRLGNGKSSFVNTLNAALRGIYEQLAQTNASDTSVTTELKIYDFGGKYKFRLLDTYGWRGDDGVYRDELKLILDGNLGEGFSEDVAAKKDVNYTTYEKIKKDVEFQDKIFGVIICFESKAVSSENILRLQQMYKRFLSSGLQPIVLFTKLDQIDMQLAKNPELLFDSQDVDEWFRSFIEKSKIPKSRVFFSISYDSVTESEHSQLVVYYLALKAFRAVLYSYCAAFVKSECDLKRRTQKRNSTISTPTKGNQTEITAVPPMEEKTPSLPIVPTSPTATSSSELQLIVVRESDKRVKEIYLEDITFQGLQNEIKDTFKSSTIHEIYKIVEGDRVLIENDKNVRRLSPNAKIFFFDTATS